MHASYRGSYGNRDNEAHEVRSDEAAAWENSTALTHKKDGCFGSRPFCIPKTTRWASGSKEALWR